MIVYGIKNCDTVKKALKWLDENGAEYEFHDFKKLGVTEEKLEEWSDKVGYETLINKKGTTWKKLSSEEQLAATDRISAYKVMQDKTSVIKRPVIEYNNKVVVGFDPKALQALLK